MFFLFDVKSNVITSVKDVWLRYFLFISNNLLSEQKTQLIKLIFLFSFLQIFLKRALISFLFDILKFLFSEKKLVTNILPSNKSYVIKLIGLLTNPLFATTVLSYKAFFFLHT